MNKTDIDSNTPIYISTKLRNHLITKDLITHGARTNDDRLAYKSPLFNAIHNKDEEMIQLLLRNGANKDNVRVPTSFRKRYKEICERVNILPS